jgi:hypothetical protein
MTPLLWLCLRLSVQLLQASSQGNGLLAKIWRGTHKAGSLKMNTALEYRIRVVQEGGRRCIKSTLNDLVHLTPLRTPLMNPPYVLICLALATQSRQSAKISLQSSELGPPPPPLVRGGRGAHLHVGEGRVPILTRGETLGTLYFICIKWLARRTPTLCTLYSLIHLLSLPPPALQGVQEKNDLCLK